MSPQISVYYKFKKYVHFYTYIWLLNNKIQYLKYIEHYPSGIDYTDEIVLNFNF